MMEKPFMEFSKQTHAVQQFGVAVHQNHPGNTSTLVFLKASLGCTQGPPAAPPPPRNTGISFSRPWKLVAAALWCPQPTLPALSVQDMQPKPPIPHAEPRPCSEHHEHNTDRHQPD